jgi:surface carbohydrate biosynthesis protein (TIGR04326 family)
MKTLLVFDDHLDTELLIGVYKDRKVNKIALFPLTSDFLIVHKVKNLLNSQGCSSITLLKSAQVIDGEVKNLRRRICKWSAKVGKWKIKSKDVKDWFLLPGCNVSTWWFSLLSEKNTLKTDAYFRIAQIHAVRKILSTGEYNFLVIAVSDKNFQQSMRYVANKLSISFKKLPVSSITHPRDTKTRVKYLLNSLGVIGDFLWGIVTWFQFIQRGYIARSQLGKSESRLPHSDSLLFVSYFPAVDEEAQNGIFRNKYALALQEKLKENHISIVWLLMPVQLDGHNFGDALNLAGAFTDKGEKLFVLEEFCTLRNAIKAFFLWLRQIALGFYLFPYLGKTCLSSEPVGGECKSITKSLWRSSFYGSVGMQGIFYALIFEQAFGEIPNITDCLYYCEMHAWEKALNAARNRKDRNIRTIGFQHTSVSKNYFHYFYDQTETIRTDKPSDLPLPDVLACNGDLMCTLLSESGYPEIKRVEAVRQLYLNRVLSLPTQPRKERPILLVAGSSSKIETKALMAFLNASFPKADEFDVWVKGHPTVPVEKIFEELGIDIPETRYTICHNNISECLRYSRAVLVPTSAVAIEALAFGCEVIIPVFPDIMLMNPLAEFEAYYHKVTSIEDLRNTMKKVIDGHYRDRIADYRNFVRRYWDINPELSKWMDLLAS